jgi:hypothetical protein
MDVTCQAQSVPLKFSTKVLLPNLSPGPRMVDMETTQMPVTDSDESYIKAAPLADLYEERQYAERDSEYREALTAEIHEREAAGEKS